ncbi:unnamed protein product [Caenorhabditis angaria]|uniref:F-box domain-containing protein n=1 Tax=Caenorhabditis angaria TaxID=860376 RepID=A0A9P1IFS4_9PELO|nr:unnamed protein product [Caenorhabditis angaria]
MKNYKYGLRRKLRKLKKKTTGWFDIPYEMRKSVISYMDTRSKGLFSCCSKLCYEEVMESTDYIKEIEFSDSTSGSAIRFRFFDDSHNFELWFLDECEDRNNIIIEGHSEACEYEWIIRKTCDVRKMAIDCMNRIIGTCINLKSFVFNPDTPHSYLFDNFGIKHLKKLDSLRVFQRWTPIDLVENGFVSLEMLYKMKCVIKLHANLNLEQLLKLSARKIRLLGMKIDSEALNVYCKMVQAGKLNENIKKLKLDMDKDHLLDPKKLENDIISFEMSFETRPDRYAMIRIEPKSFLMIIRLEERRYEYRETLDFDDHFPDVMRSDSFLNQPAFLTDENRWTQSDDEF